MNRSIHQAWLIAGAVFPVAVLAQNVNQNVNQNASLDEVVVLGTQIEESIPADLQKYGSRLEVITGEQLREGGYADLSQALQMLVPGLYVAPKNGPFDYVDASLLGSRGGDILYLIDGVRISNRLYNTTTPLDTIPAHMVERIEVLKGGQSLFYGTQAVAGVVNVVTKSFSDHDNGGVAAGFDTNDGKHVDGYARGRVGDSRLVLYGSIDKADGFQPFRDQDYQPSATDRDRSYDVRTVGGKFAQQFSIPLTLTALYQHTDATLDYADPTSAYSDFNRRNESLLSVKLDYEASRNFGVYLKTYYHDWTTHYTTITNDIGANGQLTGGRTVQYNNAFWGYWDKGLNLMTRFQPGTALEYLAGVDLQRYYGRDEVYTIAPQTEEVRALFAQVRSSDEWLPKTHLAAGARYNRTSAGEADTVWNVSGQQQLAGGWYLRAMGGTSLRLPDAYQLYGAFIDEFDTKGNPALQPEKSTNVEVGVGGRVTPDGAQLSWELTGFHRDVHNLIGAADDGFTDLDHDGNDDYDTMAVNTAAKVEMRGAELQLAVNTASGWNASFDHTYSQARAQGSDLQIDRIPRSESKLALGYRPAAGRWFASVSAIHVGDVFRVTGGARREYGGYTVADASAGLNLGASGRHRLTLTVSNLFDREYATGIGTAERDSDGSNYTFWNLGQPRTGQLRYSYTVR